MKTFVYIVSLISCLQLFAQGKVSVTVATNVNSFDCECLESDFQYQAIVDTQKDFVIQFPVVAFDCPKKLMEKDLQKLLIEPNNEVITLAVQKVQTQNNKHTATVFITLKGETISYNVPVVKCNKEGKLYLKGVQEVCLTDFKITPPTKALGMVKVKENVVITFCVPYLTN